MDKIGTKADPEKIGTKADPEKTKAVQDFPTPTNITELQHLLGMVKQLAKFIPDLANTNKPLCHAVAEKGPNVDVGQRELETQDLLGEFLTSPGRCKGLFLNDSILCFCSGQRPRSIAYRSPGAIFC